MNKLLSIFLLSSLTLSALANEDSHTQKAAEYLEITETTKTLLNQINKELSIYNIEESKKEKAINNFVEKFMPAAKDIIKKSFSEKELNDIISFYKTKTGQKCVNLAFTIVNEFKQLGSKIGAETLSVLFTPETAK